MEHDELKEQLRKQLNFSPAEKSVGELNVFLKIKTHSVIYKIRRSLWFELITTLAFAIALMVMAFLLSIKTIQFYCAFFALLSLAFAAILYLLLQKIIRLNKNLLTVKDNLLAIHSIISQYTKRYFIFSMLLIPIFFSISFITGYRQGKDGDDWEFDILLQHTMLAGLSPVTLLLFAAALTVLVYFFTSWYLEKLYGNYLKELAALLNELNE